MDLCTEDVDDDSVVDFPDPCVEDAVRVALNKPTGDITAGELLEITWLERVRSSISDLTGLEHCTNLESLSLSSNDITDLTPLTGLTRLKRLYLGNNNIVSVAPLAGLTSLEELSLSDGNQVGDLTPLSGLYNLIDLDLDRQEGDVLTDISPLASLTALTELDITGNAIDSLAPVTGMTELWRLSAGWNQITDLSPLQGLPSLKNVWLDENPISDISPLVANPGIGEDDYIVLTCCAPTLNYNCDPEQGPVTQCNYMETLEDRGADIIWGTRDTCGVEPPVLGLDKGPCEPVYPQG